MIEKTLVRVLTVIPTYNEIENLQAFVHAVLAKTPEAVEFLIVDDNSPDGTGQLADVLATNNKRIHVLHRSGKLGLGSAYIAGFKWGLDRKFDAMVEMDADFSHDPSFLPTMFKLLGEYDFVIGSRYVKGGGTVNWGMGRKLLSRGGSIYSRMILGAPIRDFTGGFNGWRRQVLEAIDLDSIQSDGYSFQIELKHRAYLVGFRWTEFPIVFEDRKVGRSKMNKRIVFEALSKVWLFRMRAEKRLSD